MTALSAPNRTTSTSALLARTGWVRVTAVDPRALEALRIPRTLGLADAWDRAQSALATTREAALVTLHAAVPAADPPTRRMLLQAKRAVHNGRPAPDVGLPGVRDYLSALRHVDALSDALSRAERDDLATAGTALKRIIDSPPMQRGLAMTAPNVHRRLAASCAADLADPRHPLARTAVAFAARAAVKPSPASSLTTVGPAVQGADVRVAPALAYSILESVAAEPAFADLIELEPPIIDESGAMILPDRLDIQGYLFRHDELVRSDVAPHLDAVLAMGRATASTHLRELPDRHALRRLVRSGLLRPVLPWVTHEERHSVLADIFDSAASQSPHDSRWAVAADHLRAVDRLSRLLASLPDDQAVPSVVQLREEAVQVLPPGARIRIEALIHESVAAEPHHAPIGPGFDTTLDPVLRPRLVHSLAHRALADFVAGLQGPGARVRLDRLVRMAGNGEDSDLRLAIWAMRDLHGPSPDDDSAPVPDLVAPSLAVHLQSAGSFAVLNSVLPGAPAAALRFQPLAERPDLTAWLSGLAPAGRWLALSTAEEWTDLQGSAFLRQPRVVWPADPPRRTTSMLDRPLTRLWAVHQPDTRTLRVEDEDGVIALLPVGTMSPFMVTGPLRIMLMLADPWIYRPVMRTPDWTEGSRSGSDRVVVDNVVLERRTWWMDAAEFPRRESGPLLGFLRGVDRWRRERDLPDEVFVQAHQRAPEMNPRRRKPQWVRWDAPHTLEVAARTAAQCDRLMLTEALPAAADATGPVSETVRLFAWPAEGDRDE